MTTETSRYPKGFWAVWTSVAMDLLGFGIIIPLLPLYASGFGASAAVIGILFASYSLAQFLFSPVWGRLSDRVGRRPVLLVTIFGSALGSLVLGLAGSLVMLFIGRIIDGISGASVAVARATVADVAGPKDRARLMGLLGAAFGVGFVLGPVIGSLAALGGPALPFFIAAAISTVNGVVAWFRVPETRASVTASTAGLGSWRNLGPVVSRLVLVTFVGVTAFSAFEATFSLLAELRLALTDSQVALLFAGVGVVLVVTQAALIGPVVRRLGEVRVIQGGLGLNVVGFALLAVDGGWSTMIPGLVALAVGQGMITPTLASSIAGAAAGGDAGVALGVQQSAGGLARVVGPALGGALFAIGAGLPYVAAGILTLFALPVVPRIVGERVAAVAH